MLSRFVIIFTFFTFALFDRAMAATDGPLGVTSTGDTYITLGVSSLVRITGIDGIDFGLYDGSGNIAENDDVCIWTNDSGAKYKVTASGDGAAHAFNVRSGGNILPYTVRWNDTPGISGNVALTKDVLSGVFNNANTSSSTCGGTMNANYEIRIDGDDLLAVRPGTYTGVLTLVITPSS
jgi:hypothetical protein